MKEESGEAHRLSRQSQGRVPQSRPQQSQRQPAQLVEVGITIQLMVLSTTGVPDPENSFCETDEDKDSEMQAKMDE